MANRYLKMAACVAALATAMATAASAQVAGVSAGSGPTPRLANGHPDLNGRWGGPGGGDDGGRINVAVGGESSKFAGGDAYTTTRRCSPLQVDCDNFTNQAVDQEFTGRLNPNRPIYKPKYWDKVQYLDMNTNKLDPIFACQPYGVTRSPPPARIIQTDNDVVFLHRTGGAASSPADYRVIPTDGRPHDPEGALDVTYYGDSVGKWEGDTLVIDSVGFNDITWLQRGGYFHSDQMHLVEKFRREGDTLVYQITVEDPEVLVQPWVMDPIRVRFNTNPDPLPEGTPCKDYDLDNMVSQIRH